VAPRPQPLPDPGLRLFEILKEHQAVWRQDPPVAGAAVQHLSIESGAQHPADRAMGDDEPAWSRLAPVAKSDGMERNAGVENSALIGGDPPAWGSGARAPRRLTGRRMPSRRRRRESRTAESLVAGARPAPHREGTAPKPRSEPRMHRIELRAEPVVGDGDPNREMPLASQPFGIDAGPSPLRCSLYVP
jgi:hypothetical protein